MPKRAPKEVNNVIVVSDLHCGCKLGLCPPAVKLDDGSGDSTVEYVASRLQLKVWQWWEEFWGEWVPAACRHEPFAVVVNGDAIDGVHHGSKTQISHNFNDQLNIAESVLRPIVDLCEGRFYMTRGTEAHVGKSQEFEEMLARRLGAVPNDDGIACRSELWLMVGGDSGALCHLLHHIGTSASPIYENTALRREMVDSIVESARWGDRFPDVIVRSHRHRYNKDEFATHRGMGICVTTPGWQLKTPFTFKVASARLSQPTFGGIMVRAGDEEFYTRNKVWRLSRPRPERIGGA